MLKQHDVSSHSSAVTQTLAQLALQLLGDQHPRPLAADTGTPDGATRITVLADQVKARGAGRRPASLVGRDVTVTLVATVDAENDDGTVTVSLAAADRTPPRRRVKKTAAKGGKGK